MPAPKRKIASIEVKFRGEDYKIAPGRQYKMSKDSEWCEVWGGDCYVKFHMAGVEALWVRYEPKVAPKSNDCGFAAATATLARRLHGV
jgi:hypothetical protein